MKKIKWRELSELQRYEIMVLENSYLKSIYESDIGIEFNLIIKSNQIIAYIAYKNHELAYDIYNIVVKKQYRKLGYATNLYADLNDKPIYLEVNENNIEAINLYYKLGFKKIKEINNYYDNQNTAYIMVKHMN